MKYHHRKDLISADSNGFVYINSVRYEPLDHSDEIIECLLRNNNIFLNTHKLWANLLKEYRKNYSVYDAVPLLLLYNIPVVFHKTFNRGKNLIGLTDDQMIDLFIKSQDYLKKNVPNIFRIERGSKAILVEVYNIIKPYLKKEITLTNSQYESYVEYLWLKEWKRSFNKNQISLTVWREEFYRNRYMQFVVWSGDNYQIVTNLMNRYIGKETEKLSKSNAN